MGDDLSSLQEEACWLSVPGACCICLVMRSFDCCYSGPCLSTFCDIFYLSCYTTCFNRT